MYDGILNGPKGYELVREVGVSTDFIKFLVPVFEMLSEPLSGRPPQERQKMRVVIDYDPKVYKVKFRYYIPNDGQGETEHQ